MRQLQIAVRCSVHEHVGAAVQRCDLLEIRDLAEVLLQVPEEGTGSGERSRHAFASESLERRDAEMPEKHAICLCEVVGPVAPVRAEMAAECLGIVDVLPCAFGQQDLLWFEPAHLVADLLVCFEDHEFAGRHVGCSDPVLSACRADAEDIGVLLRVLGNMGARRDHLDDAARYYALRLLRVFHLLADRDLVTCLDQLGYVCFGREVGNAAHGHGILFCLVPRREGDLKDARGFLSILPEHLVKISQPEEQDRIAMLLLDAPVLLHEGSEFRHITHII